MPKPTKKKSKTWEGKVMVLQLLETEPEQLTKIGAIIWATVGAAIGCLLILLSVVGLLLNLIPGTPQYPISGSIYLIFVSILITIGLTLFYGMAGAVLGSLTSNTVNWVLRKMGGILFRVRKLG
jgi:hypothetical protein